MKIKNTTIRAKLLMAIVITTSSLTAAANAQPSFVGKFTLPYEVHWNNAVLPAGQYSITMDSGDGPALVSSTSGNRSVYTAVPTISDAEKGTACLTITVGNERRVRSLNLPELGQSLIFEPLTQTEREMLAKAGQIDAVPVVTAKK